MNQLIEELCGVFGMFAVCLVAVCQMDQSLWPVLLFAVWGLACWIVRQVLKAGREAEEDAKREHDYHSSQYKNLK